MTAVELPLAHTSKRLCVDDAQLPVDGSRRVRKRARMLKEFNGLTKIMRGKAKGTVRNPMDAWEYIPCISMWDRYDTFASEMDCVAQVVARDGVAGLICRGLDATLIREVPGYLFLLCYLLVAYGQFFD